MKRSTWNRIGALFCLALAMPAAPRAAANARITLGAVSWIGYGPIYCAMANGYWAKYGLDVKLVIFSDNAIMPGALQGGEVDAITLTYDQVVASNAKGWPLKVVMPIDYSAGGDAILGTSAIKDVKDLKGHTIAYSPISPSDFLLGYALQQNGLLEKDIVPVNTTPEGVPGIMASGSADAGVTYEPSVSVLLNQDGGKRFHVVMSSKDAKGMITDVLVVKDTTIAKDPKMVEGLIRGLVDGLDFMRKDPEKADAIIARALDITPEEARAQLAGIENPPLAQMADVFTKSDALPSFFASGPVIAGILKNDGQIDAAPPVEASFDADFVKSIQASPGD
jgi:NitT/TauT family transport system substrate-binding protein